MAGPKITYVRDPDLAPPLTPVYIVSGSIAVNLSPGDITVGAVEIKGDGNNRKVQVDQANSATSAGMNVLRVQNVDDEGGVLRRSDVQNLDAGIDLLIAGQATVNSKLPSPGLSSGSNCVPVVLAHDVVSKVQLYAENEIGSSVHLNATAEGHLEVAIHDPVLPFGGVHTEKLTPVFQNDFVYGINRDDFLVTTSLSGYVDNSNNIAYVNSGTTVGAYSTIQTRKRLRYRPGQGILGRYTAIWSSPVSRSIAIAGFGTSESGFYFGYYEVAGASPEFGILHVKNGAREVRTLTVTTKSSNAENITVQLNGVNYTVPVTNGATTAVTALEISRATYAGWQVEPVGSTVVFLANDAGSKNDAYSISGTSVAGTFSRTRTGVTSTDVFIPQSEWNGDKLDGTGGSGFTLNPQLGNVYQIQIHYLGFGPITFRVMTYAEGQNNPSFVTCHVIKYPNTATIPHTAQPSFPFTMASYSAGSSTNVTVGSASMAGFVCGDIIDTGGRYTVTAQSTSVGATDIKAIASYKNSYTFNGRANQATVHILSMAGACKHGQPATFFLIRNGTLSGTPDWQSLSPYSPSYSDVAGGNVTYGSPSQLIASLPVAETGGVAFSFEDRILLQPGETATLGCRTSTQTAAYVLMSLNTREDT